MIDIKTLGNSFRKLRIAQGLTIYELAIALDYDYKALSKNELGKEPPTTKNLVNLANYFKVGIDELTVEGQDEGRELIHKVNSMLSTLDDVRDINFLFDVLMILKNGGVACE